MLEEIQQLLKEAMKEKDEAKVSTYRMLISEMKYAQIEKRSPLSKEEALQVIQRAIKKRKEAQELYEKGGRPELAAKEAAEAKILEQFVPAGLDEAAARAAVAEIIAELGVTDKKEMGRVMKEVMARYKGRIDGKLVQKLVGEKLT